MPTVPTIKTCWLPRGLADQLLAWAGDWRPLEVGGILGGYHAGDNAVITDLVGPGPEAIHSTSHFLPDPEYHVAEMRRIHHASNGGRMYLGDWHTHPRGPSVLSPLDRRTLRAIARSPEAQCPRPLMLLAAQEGGHWQLHAFTLTGSFRSRATAIAVRLYGR